MLRQKRAQTGFVTRQKHTHPGMAISCNGKPGHDHIGSSVSPHPINRKAENLTLFSGGILGNLSIAHACFSAMPQMPYSRTTTLPHGNVSRLPSGANSDFQCLTSGNHFTTIVVAAVAADVVRALQLTTVGAFSMSLHTQSLMAATHATT
ncbi:hypothetical protein AA14362_0094 [Acetobacter cerevisiae DSM 14362]|nr:hypothetical protein AA14362_0094 [Acetobacter cerevisiae DSM 14362]